MGYGPSTIGPVGHKPPCRVSVDPHYGGTPQSGTHGGAPCAPRAGSSRSPWEAAGWAQGLPRQPRGLGGTHSTPGSGAGVSHGRASPAGWERAPPSSFGTPGRGDRTPPTPLILNPPPQIPTATNRNGVNPGGFCLPLNLKGWHRAKRGGRIWGAGQGTRRAVGWPGRSLCVPAAGSISLHLTSGIKPRATGGHGDAATSCPARGWGGTAPPHPEIWGSAIFGGVSCSRAHPRAERKKDVAAPVPIRVTRTAPAGETEARRGGGAVRGGRDPAATPGGDTWGQNGPDPAPPGSSPAPALPIKADGKQELRSPEKCSQGWQSPARGAWGGNSDRGTPPEAPLGGAGGLRMLFNEGLNEESGLQLKKGLGSQGRAEPPCPRRVPPVPD